MKSPLRNPFSSIELSRIPPTFTMNTIQNFQLRRNQKVGTRKNRKALTLTRKEVANFMGK